MRWCTSDLKRDPIAKVIRQQAKARGAQVVISCEGLRAEESCERAKKSAWELNRRLSSGSRTVYTWRPILDWSTERVFETIAAVGQEPHWAYASGMTRLSCAFCIMSSPEDLRTAAKLRADLYARYVAIEKHLGLSMLMPKKGHGPRFLEDVTGIYA
jgi:3'-phosphoadenosine 5'-phosphosulfate sulfotransferase (PAPS reductase)/FAD synthetase